jgi:hypothetical protein
MRLIEHVSVWAERNKLQISVSLYRNTKKLKSSHRHTNNRAAPAGSIRSAVPLAYLAVPSARGLPFL